MNLQMERITSYCQKLNLTRTPELLDSLAEEAAQKELSYTDFTEKLLETEAGAAYERRTRTILRFARLPYTKTLEEFDFSFQPSVDKKKVLELATLRFLDSGQNIILLGPPGVGKTHLAVSLGLRVAQAGLRLHFTTATEMMFRLRAGLINNTFDKRLKLYLTPSLLIIDEIGYLPLDQEEASLFFQVISKRYEKGSMILTSNKSYGEWGEIMGGDTTIASAILDRLLHHSTTINIKGESYRLKEKKKAGVFQELKERGEALNP